MKTVSSPLARLLVAAGAAAVLALLAVRPAGAHDVPDRMVLHAYVKPEGPRAHVIVRIPLIMLASLGLPKRGVGYLDLARIEPALERAAAASARELALLESGVRISPATSRWRVVAPSDRSFDSFETARASFDGPPPPEDTNIFWNQGYFDAHYEYPIRAEDSDLALDVRAGAGLSGRVKVVVRYLPPGGAVRAFDVPGGHGRLALDPRWHQAAGAFAGSGFRHILDGTDHLLFLLCLVIPFYRRIRELLLIVTAFTVAHSITLIAAARGLAPAGDWFAPLVEVLIAASILFMALENILGPGLRRRWLLTAAFGLVHGFGFAFVLREELPFAGDHLWVSLLAFNVGVELGQIAALALIVPALMLLFRFAVAERLGGIILSAFVAHTGWHWMLERGALLARVEWPELPAVEVVAVTGATLAALLVGLAALLVARRRRSLSSLFGRHPADG